MDHDGLPLDIHGPPSYRVRDLRDFYSQFTHQGLLVMGDQIEASPAYASNENGHFAWDISLLIRAACLAWRVTADPAYLRLATAWAQRLLERTDTAAGRLDWRGRSEPVWSAGSRYTAGTARVGAVNGTPVHLQASADRIIIERPSRTTAVVRAVRPNGRDWVSPEASLLPEDDDYLPDVLAQRSSLTCVLLRGLPAPSDLTFLAAGNYPLEPQFAPHLVHTGMIARSLITLAQHLPCSRRASSAAVIAPTDLYTGAERALRSHDDEIRVRDGKPWYITPYDFPSRRLGLELPHNHTADAATSFMLLGRHRGDHDMYNFGASLARRFLDDVAAYEAGAVRHPWFYYPVDSDAFRGVTRDQPLAERSVSAVRRAEDSSHATMRVRALAEWKATAGDLVPDDTMSTIARSLPQFFMMRDRGRATLRWLAADKNDAPRRGQSDSYAGAWSALVPWDATLRRRINSMAFRHPPSAAFGATVLSAAEIFALNAGVPICVSSDRTARA